MATVSEPLSTIAPAGEASKALASQWRRLIRAATLIALLTSPLPFLFLYVQRDWPLGWAIVVTFLAVIAYRGLLDIVLRRLIPWPSLFGADEQQLKDEDVVNRRRAWYWQKRWKLAYVIFLFMTALWRDRAADSRRRDHVVGADEAVHRLVPRLCLAALVLRDPLPAALPLQLPDPLRAR